MTRIALLSAIVATILAGGESAALGAGGRHPAPPISARLQGSYILEGRVTVATDVRGEHVGDHITRRWKFTPGCPAGTCSQVGLTRGRHSAIDPLVLRMVAPGVYRGSGVFFRPLRCGHRLYRRGEKAPFTITVRITAAADLAGVTVATEIHARYANRRRVNLTRCVRPPARDSAVYDGHVTPA